MNGVWVNLVFVKKSIVCEHFVNVMEFTKLLSDWGLSTFIESFEGNLKSFV